MFPYTCPLLFTKHFTVTDLGSCYLDSTALGNIFILLKILCFVIFTQLVSALCKSVFLTRQPISKFLLVSRFLIISIKCMTVFFLFKGGMQK